MKIELEIHDSTINEFNYMLELYKQHGSPSDYLTTPEDLINYILSSVADGSRRPGSWERGLLDSMGLVADTDEHHVYRNDYGKPGV